MRYQVGGSLRSDDPTYVVRQADEKLYASLKAGDFCYVLNSRQMGKSSLLQRTSYRLQQEGYECAYLDVTRLGSEDTTPEQWYKGIIISLFYSFNLAGKVNFKSWWEMQTGISLVQRLGQFVEEILLPNIPSDRIFIFLDEIDSLLSLNFAVNDFFAWIRHCYNQQANDPNYQRLGFALFGVASPSDLITDKRRTPFNIGTAIELYGFQLNEATPLLQGLEEVVNQSQAVLREIIYWSGGQPFLTQKLCQLVVQTALETSNRKIDLPPDTATFWVEQLVRSQVIQHWEAKDEPEHLRTIRDRLLFHEHRAGRLLELYQRVLQAEEAGEQGSREAEFSSVPRPVPTDDSREQTELLLSGLVERRNGYLRIKNPIYRSVFNSEWVLRQLNNLRPYSQTFNAWVASGYQDESRLLRGQALQEVLNWTQHKSLGDLDYRFLAASQELERRETEQRLEAERVKEVEARLASEQKSARRQQRLLLAVSVGLVVAIVLGIATYYAYRQSAINEVKAIAAASNGNFNSNQHLNALVQAIQARLKFQRLNILDRTDARTLELQTRQILEQAVYGADEVNRLSAHRGIVTSVVFSPDGQWIATSSTDRTIKIWKRDGTLLRTLQQTATIHSVRFSPNSRQVAGAGLDGTVSLWTIDGKLLTVFKGHKAAVWRIAFSPDGLMLASASGDRTVKVWRLDGTLIKTLQHELNSVWGVAFSPDGQTIASGTADGIHRLWRLDGTLITTFQDSEEAIWNVAFSPDGQTLVSGSADNKVRLWSRDGKLLKILNGHTAEVLGVAFSSDGKTIASTGADKTIKLWGIDGILLRTFEGHSATIRDVAFSPNGETFASASDDNTAKLWRTSPPLVKLLNSHRAIIWRVAFSPDGQILASIAGQDIKLWRRDGSLINTFSIVGSRLLSLTFSPDGQTLAFAGADGIIRLWQPDRDRTDTFDTYHFSTWDITYSPDGKSLVTVGDDLTLKLWQLNSKGQFQLQQSIKAHTSRVWDVAYSSDRKFIATASADGTVKLWRWSRNNQLNIQPDKILTGHNNDVWGVAISPDSQLIATAGRDDTLRLWRPDGTLVRVISGGTIALTRVAFSPDSKLLAAASADGSVKLWKIDGTLVTTLKGHTSSVQTVAFSSDGKTLASGGDDQVVVLWDLQKIFQLNLLSYGCDWVRDYLQTNTAVAKSDRHICDPLSSK